MRKWIWNGVIAIVLVAAIIGGTVWGSHYYKNQQKQELADNTYVSMGELADSIKRKYEQQTPYGYNYGEPIEGLKRSEEIRIPLEFVPEDITEQGLSELYQIYLDPELTQMIRAQYSFDEETMELVLAPSIKEEYAKIYLYGLPLNVVKEYESAGSKLFDKGLGFDWGNMGTLYLKQCIDENDGEELKTPVVRIITQEGEIKDKLWLRASVGEDGRPSFSWNAVEGADYYLLCKMEGYKNSYSNYGIYPIECTTDTSWTAEMPIYDYDIKMNDDFRIYRYSEDDWKNERQIDFLKENGYADGEIVYRPDDEKMGICVIAINRQGSSMSSNRIKISELAPNLPYQTADYHEREKGFQTIEPYQSVKELPLYDYVIMCDGHVFSKLINYETENAQIIPARYLLWDEERGEALGSKTVDTLIIPYTVEGTLFSGSVKIYEYDKENLENDIAYIEDREDKVRRKAGEKAPLFTIGEGPKESGNTSPEYSEKELNEAQPGGIFATCALSEYLATNMLEGAQLIDLSNFPEAKDMKLLQDALLEAYYQNPMILGIQSYYVNSSGDRLRIEYDDDPNVQAGKQQEIQDNVKEVVSQIIQDNMTDEEKEIAINEYLCQTIEYDESALLSAENYDYMQVDSEFNDSFTAYGALINGKCVCAGYAAAFKLLAEEAGLSSIVVTGMLDGTMPHAWNKVNINGEWQIIDVTNNDSDYIGNALFNLPENVSSKVLVEDKEYLMDMVIADYMGEGEEYEYYHITDSFFPVEEMGQKLAESLQQNEVAVLRTDYNLSDNEFYEITDAVYDILGDDVKLRGYHWLGVIYLTLG